MNPPPKTTLLVIRHGETEWNVAQRFQGQSDSPLTDKGRNQVRALGRRMARMDFDALISSDLGRTKKTAAIIAEATGHGVRTDPRLRERHFGVLEGLTMAEIESRHADVYQKLRNDRVDYILPQGESLRQHYLRNIDFLESFAAENAGITAALVVHGGVLDSLLRFVTGLSLDHPPCFTAVNAGLNIISHGQFYGTARWVVETWGDVAHFNRAV